MRALVLEHINHLAIKDVPEPACGPDEVLVAVKAVGICGSDVHGMDGSSGRRIPPIIMGHEAAGVIATVGRDVSGWQAGDRVTFDSTIYCGTCHYCRQGMINFCDRRRVLGVSCDEYRQHGAFCELVAVPARILYRLPDSITFVQAAMVEPTAIAFHAVEIIPIRLNDSAVVIGAGTIGLLAVQALRMAGCGPIFAVDLDPTRLALARELGADEVLQPDRMDVVAHVMARTGGRGVDLACEAVGINATVDTAVRVLRKGGSLTLVGNLQPRVDLLLQAVVTRQLRIQGSNASCGEYPASLDAIVRGAVRVDPLISAVAPLTEGAAWFKRLYEGEPGLLKVILTP